MPGALALLLPLLAGIVMARGLFRLNSPLAYMPVGMASGWLGNAMAANLLLRFGASLEQAMIGSTLLVTSLGACALLLPKGHPEREQISLSLWAWLYLLFFSVLVYLTSVSVLFLNPDDDFWLHAPMQAQLLQGNFPIMNPVFPHLNYGGHYARDLSMVMFSWWSGVNLYATQAPVTAFFQVVAFWLIFLTGLRFGRSESAAVLSSLFVFMGVNAAGRGGWLDTVSNNNALAQLHTALLLFLFLKILLEHVSWGQVAASGVLFAGLAWSYETSFVSLSFSLLAFALIVTLKGELKKRQLQVTALVIAVSLAVLVLQGGLFGELFTRVISGDKAERVKADITTQAQNLEVSVKFPKEKFLQIKLTRAGDEISLAYHTFPWFQKFDITPKEPGYVSIFSSAVLRIHWLSLYLCPLSLLMLWRFNNKLGFLYWGYGLASYLIPAVIDFGLWETEVFRWEYAASWGFAGALGVALGEWSKTLQKPPIEMTRSHFVLSPQVFHHSIILLLVWLNCYPTWVQVEQRTEQLPSLRDGFLMPTTQEWLAYHPVLGMAETDITAGLKLADMIDKEEKFLMTRRAGSAADMLAESAFVGLTGAQTVGHAFPLQYERLGTPPFRQSAEAIAFWASGDSELLRNGSLDWLYVKEVDGRPSYSETKGLREVIRETDDSGDRVAYRISLEPFPAPKLSLTPHPRLSLDKVRGLEHLGTEEYRKITATVKGLGSPADQDQILSYRFYHPDSKEEITYEEGLSQKLQSLSSEEISLHFVSPHNPGRVLVRLYVGPGAEQQFIGEFEVETVQLKAFGDLKVDWKKPLEALQGGLVQAVDLEFYNPTRVSLRLEGLVGLTASTPEFPTPPRDFQTLDIHLEPEQAKTVRLMVVPPRQAGQWPFELMLHPKDGLRKFQLSPRTVTY